MAGGEQSLTCEVADPMATISDLNVSYTGASGMTSYPASANGNVVTDSTLKPASSSGAWLKGGSTRMERGLLALYAVSSRDTGWIAHDVPPP